VADKILLVEGIDDSTFYVAICRERNLRSVEIKTPKSGGAPFHGKTNLIHILPIFLQQLDDGSITNIGVVVDADYEQHHGLGFGGTLAKIREKVVAHGFRNEERLATGGLLFEHTDGLAPFGAWIMPDNKRDGMLEDFVKDSISAGIQTKLYSHASDVVGKLKQPLFKDFHRSKAEVATWLSWQEIPGSRIESVVGNHLIDLKSPGCEAFAFWLHRVFD
jgi:hypothetical protein